MLGTKSGKPIKAKVKLNGEPIGDAAGSSAPDGVLTINNHTLYEIVNQDAVKNGLLEIITNDAGLEAYAFTFGS